MANRRHQQIRRYAGMICGACLVLGMFSAAGLAQVPQKTLLLQAEDDFQRGLWADAEKKFRDLESQTTTPTTPETLRLRRICLSKLAETYRRLGNHQDSLRFAELYGKEIKGDELRELRQQNAFGISESQLALKNYLDARATLIELRTGGLGPLKDFLKLQVLVRLASVEHFTGHLQDADQLRQEADEVGRGLLKRVGRSLSPDERVLITTRIVECQEALQRTAEADQLLEALWTTLAELPDGKLKQFRASMELGAHASQRKDFPRVEKHFRQALDSFSHAEFPRLAARIHQLLANAYRGQQLSEKAQTERVAAVECLKQLLVESAADAVAAKPSAVDLKQLRNLYQQLGNFADAISIGQQLVQVQTAELGPTHADVMESKSVLGFLQSAAGNNREARSILSELVEDYRRQENGQASLARALNNLGAVEQGAGDFAKSVERFSEALELREKHLRLPPEHPDLAKSYNNLASVYLIQNKYGAAIDLYVKALEGCQKSGPQSNSLRSRLLLNLAMAYKSLGQFKLAARYCRESLDVLEETVGSKTMLSVGHYNALAAMESGLKNYHESAEWAQQSLAVCQANRQEQHPAAASAHIQIGIAALRNGDFGEAEKHWKQSLEIQMPKAADEFTSTKAAEAFTRNLLGLVAFQKGQFDVAKQYFEKASELQASTTVSRQDQYNTLCNLAAVYREEHRNQDAYELLGKAIEIPEAIRKETYGQAEQGRARYLAQFMSAFETRVEWGLKDGDFDTVIDAAEQSRNRTFLDQLKLAGIDLRKDLPANVADALLAREEKSRIELSRLRMQTTPLQEHSNSPESKKEWLEVRTKFKDAQTEYADVWNSIRDVSPHYRKVLEQDWEKLSLGQIQQNIDPDTLVLFYRLGEQHSFVLVIDQQAHPTLIKLAVAVDRAKKLSPVSDQTPNVEPLTRQMTLTLVTWYRQALAQKQFDRARSKDKFEITAGITAPTTSVAAVADIVLPEPLRNLISKRKPKKLVIIPDGALHNLPFEALLIRDGQSLSYVLDTFPPICYAPSANILIKLMTRRDSAAGIRRSLVTLGNPHYGVNVVQPKGTSTQTPTAVSPDSTPEPLRPNVAASFAFNESSKASGEISGDMVDGLLGVLPLLKGTQKECDQLAECCERRGMSVKKLLGPNATEKNFVESVRGRGILHLAAHGIMDKEHGNLFGAIALTSSAEATPNEDNDGFLSYNEILRLPLNECELAVLSAGQTNVGPDDRPFEAGTTLAQAFLAAGARRVVASHWSVSDESTAELMRNFFDIIAVELRKSGRLDAASALHQAKLKMRDKSGWKNPYHWAPFVLLGPTD